MSWADGTCVAQVWEPSGWHWHVCGRLAKNCRCDAFPLCGIHIRKKERSGLDVIAANGVTTYWGKGPCVMPSHDTNGTPDD